MARYEIQTLRDASTEDRSRLSRAVARLDLDGHAVVRRVAVGRARGNLRVEMDLASAEPLCLLQAERVFREVWYDAFGDRTARHWAHLLA